MHWWYSSRWYNTLHGQTEHNLAWHRTETRKLNAQVKMFTQIETCTCILISCWAIFYYKLKLVRNFTIWNCSVDEVKFIFWYSRKSIFMYRQLYIGSWSHQINESCSIHLCFRFLFLPFLFYMVFLEPSAIVSISPLFCFDIMKSHNLIKWKY